MSKYRNRIVMAPEGRFDSQREYARFKELQLMERAGQITSLRRQVKYELIPRIGRHRPIYFVADFEYHENGERVVEDSKGYRNRLYLLKRRLMLYRHQIEVYET